MKKNVYSINAIIEDNCHGGEGSIRFARVFETDSFQTKIDFIDFSIIPPESTIGYHRHSNNEEIYFILEGEGKMNMNGSEFLVRSGDVIINSPYSSHGLKNIGKNEIKLFVFQVSN